MNHKEFEEQVFDFLEGELSEKEEKDFLAHMDACPGCARILDQYKSIDNTFSQQEEATASPLIKMEFEAMLDREKFRQQEVQVLDNSSKRPFKIAASLLLLFMGYAIGEFRTSSEANNQFAHLESLTEELKKERTLAMLENRSVSKRIQAVNYSEEMPEPQEEVLLAIIDRLHYDENINVRLAAAEALSRFDRNEVVKDAFLHSLRTEKNPDVQIAVIQFLVKAMDKRAKEPMQNLLLDSQVPIFVRQQLHQGLEQII